jgi:hypothetical protein
MRDNPIVRVSCQQSRKPQVRGTPTSGAAIAMFRSQNRGCPVAVASAIALTLVA